jgi:hypothetical protein
VLCSHLSRMGLFVWKRFTMTRSVGMVYDHPHVDNSHNPIKKVTKKDARPWVGCLSFADKNKKRPKDVIVKNLCGNDWEFDDFDFNSYCDSRGSFMGQYSDMHTHTECPAYLGHVLQLKRVVAKTFLLVKSTEYDSIPV